MAPVLALGRVYNNGIRSETTQIGELDHAFISSLRDAEIVRLSDVPPAVFSDGRKRNSDQKLLFFRTPELDVFIPPLELVRRLFLHDRVLANVILRHGGLQDLWTPIQPGFPENLLLQFTRAMPQRLLTEGFVREFAWLAVHPTGVASWNSVASLSNRQDGVMLLPPKLDGFKMTYRGLFGGGAALVYEILSLPSKTQHFKKLDYTHPALKESASRPSHKGSGGPSEAVEQSTEKVQKDFEIEGGSSRVCGDSDVVDLMCPGSDFVEHHGNVRRCRTPVSESAASDASAPTEGAQAGFVTASATQQRQIVKVSVSDISTTPELPPLSFRILQLASPEYIGDLEPMLDTLRRMRELLPSTVEMATSLCAVPETSPLARAGRHRRPCLVATFSPARKLPVILLEVDHSGLTSLSALSLHTRKKATPDKLEVHIDTVLDSLESGGRWPHDLEQLGGEDFTVHRIKRMLRNRRRVESPEYQTRWAVMLIEKIGLG